MPFINASRESILKAEAKDEFYQNVSRQHVNKAFQAIFGDQKLIIWQNELKVLADLLYYGLTTLSGLQTLGEEYGGMIQVVGDGKKTVPSFLTRFIYVLLKSLHQYFMKKILDGQIISFFEGMNEKEKLQFKVVLDFIKNFLPTIHLLHTMVFYLDGVYHSIAKRFCGIQYVLVRPLATNESDVEMFKFFAILTGIQIVCSTIKWIRQLKMDLEKISEEEEAQKHNLFQLTQSKFHSIKCVLCLENITHMSVTPCGHLFCWHCIMEAIYAKNECPSCRKPTKLSRIIYLQHFLYNQET